MSQSRQEISVGIALTASVLVLVIAFGAAIKPLAGDDLIGPLHVAEEQEASLVHRGIDPIGIEAIGLTVVERRVFQRELTAQEVGDPLVDVRVLRLGLQRTAILDQGLGDLTLLGELVAACGVLGEALLGRSAAPGQRDDEERKQATRGGG